MFARRQVAQGDIFARGVGIPRGLCGDRRRGVDSPRRYCSQGRRSCRNSGAQGRSRRSAAVRGSEGRSHGQGGGLRSRQRRCAHRGGADGKLAVVLVPAAGPGAFEAPPSDGDRPRYAALPRAFREISRSEDSQRRHHRRRTAAGRGNLRLRHDARRVRQLRAQLDDGGVHETARRRQGNSAYVRFGV